MEKATVYIKRELDNRVVFTAEQGYLVEINLNGMKRTVSLHKTKNGKFWMASDAATGLGLAGGRTRIAALNAISKAKYAAACADRETMEPMEAELAAWLTKNDTDSDDERNFRNRGRRLI